MASTQKLNFFILIPTHVTTNFPYLSQLDKKISLHVDSKMIHIDSKMIHVISKIITVNSNLFFYFWCVESKYTHVVSKLIYVESKIWHVV